MPQGVHYVRYRSLPTICLIINVPAVVREEVPVLDRARRSSTLIQTESWKRTDLGNRSRRLFHTKSNKSTTNTMVATSSLVKPMVSVTITSDLICPWCYIGLRKLQKAAKQANIDTEIHWKPFMLRPDHPDEGVPKGGTPVSRVGERLRAAGEPLGINFTGLTPRTPNTELFHAVMKTLEEEPVTQTAFQDVVFDYYFTQGIYPDKEGLMQAAKESGVGEQVSTFLRDTTRVAIVRSQVRGEAREASRSGVSGVPSFQFNGDPPAFSGAQHESTFVAYLKEYSEH